MLIEATAPTQVPRRARLSFPGRACSFFRSTQQCGWRSPPGPAPVPLPPADLRAWPEMAVKFTSPFALSFTSRSLASSHSRGSIRAPTIAREGRLLLG